jgi:ATP-dependent helicase HrpB
MPNPDLPIHLIRDEILSTLRSSNRLVLTAPTGSGKTTQVPQFLLKAATSVANGAPQQIIVLQPRRIAARMVAERVARELGTQVGDVVGYQTRHDSRVGSNTIIRFLTEGLFLRQLQGNPTLRGVSHVLLDEFHERNLATDTAIALVKSLQESHRPDLRMIVMSATLDVRRVSAYLNSPTLETHGRLYPVQTHYLQKRTDADPWDLAADAVAELLDRRESGDVLIFMPGAYEIRRTIERCERHDQPGDPLSIFPLYSELPAREQDAALAPAPNRKIIVSTNVAETSITIEGVRHVIDSGLARVNRFDPRRGINVLMIEPISKASADQRAGRAGRTAPGTCTRLWTENDHRARPAHETPEIQRLDLAEVVLHLKSLGVDDLATFPWLEPPNPLALQQAIDTLEQLGALDERQRLTDLGHQMSRLPMHPRLSRMLIEAAKRNCLDRATLWAAFISERDIILKNASKRFSEDLPPGPRSDFPVLEKAFDAARAVNFDVARCSAMGLNALAAREVDKTRRLYADAVARTLPGSSLITHRSSLKPLAESLLTAFPSHLAQRRSDSNLACALAGNRRGQLDPGSVAKHVGLLLPIEIREVGAGTTVKTVLSLVTEIDRQWLDETHADRITHERHTFLNPDTLAVETVDRALFEGLVLGESPREVDKSRAADILAEEIFKGNLKLERWDEAVDQWIDRTRCVAQWFPERGLIAYDADDRRLILSEFCAGATRFKEVRDKPVLDHVKNALSWEDQRFVEQMAPERLQLPRGWRMKIDYTPGQPPRGRAKIQDLYDLTQTPTVAGGRVRLILEILGPNFRPVQLTDDLANFWTNLYPTLKKELSRKYPRHEWR